MPVIASSGGSSRSKCKSVRGARNTGELEGGTVKGSLSKQLPPEHLGPGHAPDSPPGAKGLGYLYKDCCQPLFEGGGGGSEAVALVATWFQWHGEALRQRGAVRWQAGVCSGDKLGDAGRPLEWVERCSPKPYVEVLTPQLLQVWPY